MASEDIKEALKSAAIQIRDEKQAGANTALRVGSLLLAICEALSLTPDELEKIFLRKDKDDRSVGKVSSDKAIEIGEYVAGTSGAIIYKDVETGHTIGEIDKLYIRMKAYFETLEIINTNSIGGKQILSPAGAVTCIGVDELDTCYRCYFLAEQDGTEVENRWKKDDQAYSKSFNVKTGVSENVSSKMYWRLVVAVDDTPVEYNGKMCHYIDLSKTDCIEDSDIPKNGDIINHRGNRTYIDRQNFVEMSSVDAFSPSVTLYHGVDGYDLTGKEVVQFGVDKTTGKSFMHVYGDMYVGARDESSFLRYTPEKGLEIKGTISVGTKLSDGRDLEEALKASTPEGYKEFVESVNGSLDYLQKQIDGSIDSYFLAYDPTMENAPAVDWTDEQKEAHLGDTFTNSSTGDSWRFGKVEEIYQWIYIEDTATKKALAEAAKAKDAADGKRRTFVITPTLLDAYDVGDLWVNATFGQYKDDILKCVVAKKANEPFDIAHWSKASNYIDDSQLKTIQLGIEDMSEILDQLGVDVESIKQQTDREFTIWFFNHEPTLNNEPASNWNTPELKAEHDQDMFYYREAGKAWRFENGNWNSITDQDTLRALELIAATRKDLSDMEYLTKALDKYPSTEIANGLLMTSLVAVQNENKDVEAFLNGSDLAKDESHGKLLLTGGIPEGTEDFNTRAKKAITRIYEDGTIYANKGIFGGYLRSTLSSVQESDATSITPLFNDRAWKLVNQLYIDATFEEVVLPCSPEYAGARAIIMDTYIVETRTAHPPTIIRDEAGNGIICGLLSTDDIIAPHIIPAIMIVCGAVELIYKYVEVSPDVYEQRWVVLTQSCATFEIYGQ